MAGNLSSRQIKALSGREDRRLVKLEQNGSFPDRHDRITELLDRGVTNDQAVIGQVLAHRFAHELALGLARRRDRHVKVLGLGDGKPNEQRTHLRTHILTISGDIVKA